MKSSRQIHPISRRDFIGRLGFSLGGVGLFSLLGACRGLVKTVTTMVTYTAAHEPAPDDRTSSTSTDRASTVNTAPPSQTAPTSENLASKDFPGTVILGKPAPDSITLSVLAGSASEVYIDFGIASGAYYSQTPIIFLAANQPQEITLKELNKNAACYYRLCHRSSGGGGAFSASAENSFHTQRALGAGFTFTIDADPHFDKNSDLEEIKVAFRNILNEHSDFNLDLGDTFMTEKLTNPTYAQIEAAYVDRRNYFGIFGPSVPLFLVNGNHDGELGWLVDGTENNEAVKATNARNKYFPNPTPDGFYTGGVDQDPLVGLRRSYYAWEWGDALFIVLDPYWYTTDGKENADMWHMTIGRTQYDWLKNTLETSTSKYKFVFTHHVIGNCRGGAEWCDYYEMGGHSKSGVWEFDRMRPGWEAPLHQLFVQNKVSVVFQGHDHMFVKQERDGVIYQEVPQPSMAPGMSGAANDGSYLSGVILPSPGHLRVTVTSSDVNVEYIHSALSSDNDKVQNGGVSYSYVVG